MKIMNGNTILNSIGYSDILNCRNVLLTGETFYSKNKRKNKKGRTVSTVNNYVSLLCSILSFAYISGFIQHKPFKGVESLRKNRVKPDPKQKMSLQRLWPVSMVKAKICGSLPYIPG
jgi:integrase